MRVARLILPLLALAVLPGTAAAGHVAKRARQPVLVTITSTPALYPAFSPAVHDYVVRCTGGTHTRFTTRAAAGTAPWIAGRPRRTASLRFHAGQSVTVEGRNAAGTVDYHVRCLPADFPAFTETRTAATKDWYLATPSLSLGQPGGHYVVVFDRNGVPVWWYRAAKSPIDAKLMPGPTIAWASFPVDTPQYELHRLDGTIASTVVSPDGWIDDHDLQRDKDGNYYYLVYRPKVGVDLTEYGGPADATVLEAEIQEVSPSGQLLWSWTSDGRVPISSTARWMPSAIIGQPVTTTDGVVTYDVYHPNAISLDGNTILVSMRYTDSVFAIDRTTGDILWKLGGTPTPQSLTVVGDPYGQVPFGGQHDVRIQPDGTISVFDDGSLLNRPPRAVRYAIDTTARTATLLESVSDPAVTGSICCGSARRLVDGDWVISWGGDPVFGEYRPDGTPVLKIAFDGALFSYRVAPVAPGKLKIEALRAGMDAMFKGSG